jgi:hypothetical protein
MSVFTSSVYAEELTDVLGIGVTLNPNGSVATVTGPTIRRVTANPNGTVTANAGSLALQSDGTVWVNTTGGTVWLSLGGSGSGWNLPDDVAGIAGTTSPFQSEYIYVSASVRQEIRTKALTTSASLSNASITVRSGAVTFTAAGVVGQSGNAALVSGPTDCTSGGGAGPTSGSVFVGSGTATSTAGLSGSSGLVAITTGDSEDANTGSITLISGNGGVNSGSIVIQSGTAGGGGTRGGLTLNVPTVTSAAQAVTWTVLDGSATSFRIGTSGTPALIVLDTSAATDRVQFSASALDNLSIAVAPSANQQVGAVFSVPVTFTAGASNTDFVLPARTGGFRLVDAYIRSNGATGGTLTVQTAGGGANCTDAMVPGNANVITRASQIINANCTFASGATVRLAAAAGAPAGEAFIRFQLL